MSKAGRAQRRFQQAIAVHRGGDLAGAERLYREALRLQPDEGAALHLLGVVRAQRGDCQDAIALIERASRILPPSAPLFNDLGLALTGAGRIGDAVEALSRAIAIDPGFLPAYNNLGNARLSLGDPSAAAQAYRQALALRPDYADALGNLAGALNAQGLAEAALQHARAARALDPGFVEARNSAGIALIELGRIEEAIEEFRTAVGQRPEYVEALANLGNALCALAHYEEAVAAHTRALALRPTHLAALVGRASAYAAMRRPAEAIAGLHEALAVDAGSAEAHFELSMVLLRGGDLAAGWNEYEWRWRKRDFSWQAREFVQPPWDGTQALAGKTILLHAEQGLGDTIQFCRYAALVRAQGPRVVFEVQRPLVSLMRSLEGVDALIGQGDPLPHFDLHCALLSVPRAVATTLATVPARTPYLAPPPEIATGWAARLANDSAWRVGLAWRGSRTHREDRLRSLALAQLDGVLGVPGISFFSLHHELDEQDARRAAACPNLVHLGSELSGLDATAGLVAQLDLVISVDTSLAHLAGALGRPLWVLLAHTPDWRWLLDRDDSPWYPSARLFRQRSPRGWDEVLARVADELRRATASPPRRQ
jgi:tetratricopeptide (TPR) repeat protein